MAELNWRVSDFLRVAEQTMRSFGALCDSGARFLTSERFDNFLAEKTLRLRQENQKRIAEIKDAEKAENEARERTEMQREMDEIEDRT